MTVRAVRLSDGQHLDCHPGVLRPRRYRTRAARPQPTGVCVHNVVLLLPIDAHTSTLEHLRISAQFFAACSVVSLTLGGWKALQLVARRGVSGPRVVAWAWLASSQPTVLS